MTPKPTEWWLRAGDERGACRRTERGGMELGVAQARLREAIHGRSRDDAAKGAGDAVALIVGHDQQHVGRALGRHHGRWPGGFRVRRAEVDHTGKGWCWIRDVL